MVFLMNELHEYVFSTYSEHYANPNGTQTIDKIIDIGHGEGFCIGNIIKYCDRYGKKDGKNRKDLMKIAHYALIALYIHDLENATDETDCTTNINS